MSKSFKELSKKATLEVEEARMSKSRIDEAVESIMSCADISRVNGSLLYDYIEFDKDAIRQILTDLVADKDAEIHKQVDHCNQLSDLSEGQIKEMEDKDAEIERLQNALKDIKEKERG